MKKWKKWKQQKIARVALSLEHNQEDLHWKLEGGKCWKLSKEYLKKERNKLLNEKTKQNLIGDILPLKVLKVRRNIEKSQWEQWD